MTQPADISGLTYEQARDELIQIVAGLEKGTESLDEAMTLWERGEALASHCENFLNAARERLEAVSQQVGEDEE